MGLEQLVAGVGPIVANLLSDLCDLEDVRYLNDAGDERIDDDATVVVTDVSCSYEPLTKKHQDMFPAGMLSASMTHLLTMIKSDSTLSIQSNFRIRVKAKATSGLVTGHGEIVFEQPGRLDFSFSPLVAVGATLRNQ